LKVYACPNCGGTAGEQERMFGMGTGDWVCANCKYTRPFSDWDIADSDTGWQASPENIAAWEQRHQDEGTSGSN